MNTKLLRMKNSKRGITPVIATIILIAVTLVLALVVGAYTFGLFGSNVKQITLTSGSLFAGSLVPTGANTACNQTGEGYISISLNNPGAATNMTGFTLTGTALNGAIVTASFIPSSSTCTSTTLGTGYYQPGLGGGAVTPITLYFSSTTTGSSLVSGQTYNYVINFKNGQSVSGVFQAQ